MKNKRYLSFLLALIMIGSLAACGAAPAGAASPAVSMAPAEPSDTSEPAAPAKPAESPEPTGEETAQEAAASEPVEESPSEPAAPAEPSESPEPAGEKPAKEAIAPDSAEEEPAQEADSAEPAEENPAEEPGAGPAAAELSAEEADVNSQLQLIWSRLDEMAQKDSRLTWYYAVMDLDHDGCLEFAAASQHPQDASTNLKVWEVSEDRSDLTECALNKDPQESFPDILADNADTFYMEADDTWSYMFYDNIVISASDLYTVKTSVSLKDGVISYKAYAVEHSGLEDGYRTVSHTDADGIRISPEQYSAAGTDAFAGAQRSNTSFDWFTSEDASSVSRLADSYAVFTAEKAPPETFPVPLPAILQHPDAVIVSGPGAVPVQNRDPNQVWMTITRNPADNYQPPFGKAVFTANASVYESLSWTFVSPSGGEYSPENFVSGSIASVSGQYSPKITVSNLETWMYGWGVYCTFYYQGQIARTNTAYIYLTF